MLDIQKAFSTQKNTRLFSPQIFQIFIQIYLFKPAQKALKIACFIFSLHFARI
jgi:hypothetical protein